MAYLVRSPTGRVVRVLVALTQLPRPEYVIPDLVNHVVQPLQRLGHLPTGGRGELAAGQRQLCLI